MVDKVIHRRQFAGQDRQFAGHEVPEAEAARIDVFTLAADKIHRNVQRIVDILFETEPLFEHEGQHARAVRVGIGPDLRAVGQEAIGAPVEER